MTARSAEELADEAGLPSFFDGLERAELPPEQIDRWARRPPPQLFLYSELPLEGAARAGRCQPLRRLAASTGELAYRLERRGSFRVLLELGPTLVAVEQERDDGRWETTSSTPLPAMAARWDGHHVRYVEGATRYELACVSTRRRLACGAEGRGGGAYCLDQRLTIRPQRASYVPHVGPVVPAYRDVPPTLPPDDCAVRCEPSDCAGALRQFSRAFPTEAVYEPERATVALFQSRADCRRFADERTGPR